MQRSNLKLERRSKAGAPQLDRGAVSSEPLDAVDSAGAHIGGWTIRSRGRLHPICCA